MSNPNTHTAPLTDEEREQLLAYRPRTGLITTVDRILEARLAQEWRAGFIAGSGGIAPEDVDGDTPTAEG